MAIPPVGTNLWTYFYRRFGNLGASANRDKALDAVLRYDRVRALDPNIERIRTEFLEGPATYERLFALPLIDYAERAGKRR